MDLLLRSLKGFKEGGDHGSGEDDVDWKRKGRLNDGK